MLTLKYRMEIQSAINSRQSENQCDMFLLKTDGLNSKRQFRINIRIVTYQSPPNSDLNSLSSVPDRGRLYFQQDH